MANRDVLKEIVEKKKEKILLAKQNFSEEDLKLKCRSRPAARPFIEAINKPRQISLIAEIKKQSPSRAIFRENFDHLEIARIYKDSGVQAISVLTEEDYFAGNISYINTIKNLVDAPILRKDFILEPYQVYESGVFGADAILLIAELLSKEKLAQLMGLADQLGLASLVEVHNEKDLKKALSLKAKLIGINNRDLHTLEVDFKTTEKLYPLIPKDRTVVVESGIKKYQDTMFLKILGVSAVLIGEAFMEAQDIKKKVEEVMGW